MRKHCFVVSALRVLPLMSFFAFGYAQQAHSQRLQTPAKKVKVAKPAQSPLIKILAKKDWIKARAMIRQQPKLANTMDAVGNRPLNMVVWSGNQEMIKFMVSQGADPNGADERGSTPLHMAIAYDNPAPNRLATVKYLVSLGANVQRKSIWGENLLHFARDGDVAQYLIGKGVKVNLKSQSWGLTPLHKAVFRLQSSRDAAQNQRVLQTLRVLIKNGATINTEDKAGHTLLDTVVHIPAAELRGQVRAILLGTKTKK